MIVLLLFVLGFTAADLSGQTMAAAQTPPSVEESAMKADEFLAVFEAIEIEGASAPSRPANGPSFLFLLKLE